MRLTIFAFLVLLFTLPARAEQVDVELVLAVDVSGSMQFNELQIQRRGYVEAFRSKQVHDAIGDGLIGAIAVTYLEWARSDAQKIIVPWTRIDSVESANAFADRLEAAEIANMRNTSITGSITTSMALLNGNAFEGMRRVIDISGDGPNNQGGLVTTARDLAVADGIIINGLPLLLNASLSGMGFGIPALDAYYRACVIGGPGAFVLPVDDWAKFAEAVRRKLVLELAGDQPLPIVRIATEPAIDCQIGEKLRRNNEF